MATARRSRDVEQDLSPARVVRLLRRLADGIEEGRSVRLKVGGESVLLPPTATIQIEHERTASREQIEIELEWPVKRARRRT